MPSCYSSASETLVGRSLLLACYQAATMLLGFEAGTSQYKRKCGVLLVLHSNGVNITLWMLYHQVTMIIFLLSFWKSNHQDFENLFCRDFPQWLWAGYLNRSSSLDFFFHSFILQTLFLSHLSLLRDEFLRLWTLQLTGKSSSVANRVRIYYLSCSSFWKEKLNTFGEETGSGQWE